ncbi:MAG: RNA polymerase sigma factor [Polyangiaceae bacterium]|nr:RNA polymerase sigma factor [Polyangiaceae bacterium]
MSLSAAADVAVDSPDTALLERISSGDKAAASMFVTRHRASVHRFAKALVRDRGIVDDVLQDTFIAALTHAGTFRGEGSARGWLFTIARRAALKLEPREQPLSEDDDLETLGVRAGWGAADPESLMGTAQTREQVNLALQRLHAEDREILVLRDMEGLSGPETAEVLQLGLAAMKSRLHRARLRFLAALRGEEFGHESA